MPHSSLARGCVQLTSAGAIANLVAVGLKFSPNQLRQSLSAHSKVSTEDEMNRMQFHIYLLTTSAAALAPFSIVRAQPMKLKIGVLLPKSGLQGLIGQSCQKGADLAPAVIRDLLGVDIELMNADTETNVDTARTRAERLIQDGAHCLVGPFDSGAAAAIAQVAEQRGVPFVINIAAAPQITEQGYKYVFRNFQTAQDIVRNGLALIGDLFR